MSSETSLSCSNTTTAIPLELRTINQERVYAGYIVSFDRSLQEDSQTLAFTCERKHKYDSSQIERLQITIPTNYAMATQGFQTTAFFDVYTESNIIGHPETQRFYLSFDRTTCQYPILDLNRSVDKSLEIFSTKGYDYFIDSKTESEVKAGGLQFEVMLECPIIQNFVERLRSEAEKYSLEVIYNYNQTAQLLPNFSICSKRIFGLPRSEFISIELHTFPKNYLCLGFEFLKQSDCAFRPEDYSLNRVSLSLFTNMLRNYRYSSHGKLFDRSISLDDIAGQNNVFGDFLSKMIDFESEKTPRHLPLAFLNDSFSICNLSPANLNTRLRGPRFLK